jgi:hypothetical protein
MSRFLPVRLELLLVHLPRDSPNLGSVIPQLTSLLPVANVCRAVTQEPRPLVSLVVRLPVLLASDPQLVGTGVLDSSLFRGFLLDGSA